MTYLDHAATTPLLPEVLEAMFPWFLPEWTGNASSVHSMGVRAARAVEEAREKIAGAVGCEPRNIIFTSSATEANNLFVKCQSFGKAPVFYSTNAEHASIKEPKRSAAHIIVNVRTDKLGRPDPAAFEKIAKRDSEYLRIASFMWVNNETGAISDVETLAEICDRNAITLHTDASQALPHVFPLLRGVGREFETPTAITISSHKIGGPLGAAALIVDRATLNIVKPLIEGGGQEQGLRSGTLNVPAIVGFGEAVRLSKLRRAQNEELWRNLKKRLVSGLAKLDGRAVLNSDDACVPNIVSIRVKGIESESFLAELDLRGVCISAGSACGAADGEPSHALLGMGFSKEEAMQTIRVSFGWNSTEADVDRFLAALSSVLDAEDFNQTV